MKTNVSVVLTDEQRNELACSVSGKPVKRLLTRKEVNELVAGFIDALLLSSKRTSDGQTLQPESHSTDLSRVPKKYRNKPRAWQLGWLRGWDKVGSGRRV